MSRLLIVGVAGIVLAPLTFWFIQPPAIVILIAAGFACTILSLLAMESNARQAITKQRNREQNRAEVVLAPH